jgi:hypothetical protein
MAPVIGSQARVLRVGIGIAYSFHRDMKLPGDPGCHHRFVQDVLPKRQRNLSLMSVCACVLHRSPEYWAIARTWCNSRWLFWPPIRQTFWHLRNEHRS